jgi:putative ABC transport system permease protein
MRGILRIAYNLLVNDRGKFTTLVLGMTFSVFLMVNSISIFSGIMRKASSLVANTGAPMWVMDLGVNNTTSSIPMPDYALDAVRSIPGVRYAVPLYSGAALVRLADGTYQPAMVIGLDDTSLLGRPELVAGRINDVYADDGFIVVRDEEYGKLERPTLGTEFEINDHRGVIRGIARVPSSGLFGMPTLYTTYSRAVEDIPTTRQTISYILVAPRSADDVPAIEADVARLGYVARTEEQFTQVISNFYMYHTGLGTNIVLMTVFSFIVGLSLSGQSFYSFTLDHLERFGALKAIGARGWELVCMIMFQSAVTSLVGYGLGVGLCSAVILLAKLRLPDYASTITVGALLLALSMVVLIAAVSGYVAVRRVLRVQPFETFRA